MTINAYFIHACYANLPEGQSTISGASLWFSLITSLLRSTFWSSLLWWGLALFKRPSKGKSLYVVLTAILSISVFFFEAYLLERYKTIYTLSIAQIMAGTNPQEVKEYLQMSFDLSTIITALVGIGILALAYRFISRLRMPQNPRVCVCVGFFYLFSVLVTIINLVYFLPRTHERVVTIGQAHNLTLAPYDRLVWSTYSFVVENEAISRLAEDIKNIDLGEIEYISYTDLQEDKPLNLVIIVGETLRRDYMHCYGYPLPNTPHLDSILATGDMIAYTDAISPAPHTIATLTSAFTYHTNDAPENKKWYNYPTLQTTLQRAGYKVSWISNQEGSGLAMQHINTLANISDECVYVNNKTFGGNTGQDLTDDNYDEDVLPHLPKDLNSPSNNTTAPRGRVQIIHLMGSHNNYDNRFPKHYEKFTPRDVPTPRGTEADQIIADYVNSVYYNDYVVGSILNHYAAQGNTLALYFSDHGEILYDDPSRPSYYGHGLLPQGIGVEVPLFVYMTPDLRLTSPALYDRFVRCKDRRIMLDLLTHTITGLLGIKTKYSDPKIDFFSDEYDDSRPRHVEGYSQRTTL